MEKINSELEEDKKGLEEVLKAQEESDFEENIKKKEQAGYLKEMMLCEKKIAKKKLELDKKVSNL